MKECTTQRYCLHKTSYLTAIQMWNFKLAMRLQTVAVLLLLKSARQHHHQRDPMVQTCMANLHISALPTRRRDTWLYQLGLSAHRCTESPHISTVSIWRESLGYATSRICKLTGAWSLCAAELFSPAGNHLVTLPVDNEKRTTTFSC